METILFLAHTEPDGSLAISALEALAAARNVAAALNAKLTAGLIGEKLSAVANQIATSGADRFLGVSGSEFAQPRYGSDAAAAEALCRAAQAAMIMAAATSRFRRALPGVAQRLNGRVDTHATAVNISDGTISVSRWYYRQRMEAVLQRSRRPWFILFEPGAQDPWQGQPGTAQVELISVPLAESCKRTTVLGVRDASAGAQTIRPEAALLLVAGAGWTKKQADGQVHAKEAEKLILEALQLTRASLGSSKSLLDLGGEGQPVLSFLTHLNQVGQTGSTPRHAKGLATCCHGEEPHTVGWRFINERRAINLDPNCGWARGKADVLYVADAFAVLARMNELLAKVAP